MIRIFVILSLVFSLVGCGKPLETDNNKVYPTYGFFNADTLKSKDVCYEVSIGNVVWSVLLFQTIVAPIYFIGFSLYNPLPKGSNGSCGIDGEK